MAGERKQGAVAYRVLLVDDDVDVRESLWALLRLDGFVVEEADCVAAARTRVECGPPDAIICDWDLGAESSEAFLVALASTSPRIARVLLSGSPGEDWQALLDAGIVHVALTKPVERHDLVAAIHWAIVSASR